jgi:hypothetical protein
MDVLFEVVKGTDARRLARIACVNNQWGNTAHDGRL